MKLIHTMEAAARVARALLPAALVLVVERGHGMSCAASHPWWLRAAHPSCPSCVGRLHQVDVS